MYRECSNVIHSNLIIYHFNHPYVSLLSIILLLHSFISNRYILSLNYANDKPLKVMTIDFPFQLEKLNKECNTIMIKYYKVVYNIGDSLALTKKLTQTNVSIIEICWY